MLKRLIKHPYFLITLVVILTTVPASFVLDISIMEARNFVTASEINEKGNWLLTTLNGEPRYQKPPLPTWIIALYTKIFPTKNLVLLRLPTILMLIVLSISSYVLMLKLKVSKSQALYAALILSTSLYIFALVTEAPWDIYAHSFMMLGIVFIYNLFQQEKINFKNVALASTFLGLSILSKGPISIYVLLIPFLASYLFTQNKSSFKNVFIKLLIVGFLSLLLSVWWFVYVMLQDSDNFIATTNQEILNWKYWNVKPWYYYWNFFIQSGLWAIFSFVGLLYPYLIKRIKNVGVYKFTFWWTIIALVLLSIIPEKKVRYIMPLLIPLALNTSFYISYAIDNFKKMHVFGEGFWVYFNYVIIVITAIVLPLVMVFLKFDYIDNHFIYYTLLYVLLIVSCIYLLKQLNLKNLTYVFYTSIFVFVIVLFLGLSLKKDIFENTNFSTIENLKSIEEDYNINTYTIGEVSPEILWYNNNSIPNIYLNNSLNLPKKNSFGLFVLDKHIDLLSKIIPANYNVKKVAQFNFNKDIFERKRLITNLYLITKNKENNELKVTYIN